MNTLDLIRPQLDRLQRSALVAAVVGALLFIVAIVLQLTQQQQHFFHSYLYAYMFWFGVTIGSLAWLLVHQVAGSGALFLVRRLLEAASRNLPLMALLFIPILIGMRSLYVWTDQVAMNASHHLQMKGAYLNTPFFIGRTVFYFAVWIGMALLLNRWSKQQHEGDDTARAAATHKLSMWSAFFLVAYVLTMTFAAIDWVMSLTPLWYSSLFGAIFIVGQGLSTLCLMHVLITYLTRDNGLTEQVPARYARDLGNLTLAFVLLWAYMNFSQLVIIWSGNIAEEAEWYTVRIDNRVWLVIGILLLVAHFALPFFALLSSALKVKMRNLARLAAFLILMRLIDLYWYVTPTFLPDLLAAPLTLLADIAAPVMLGGLWLYLWARQLKAAPSLLAVNDPRFAKYASEWAPLNAPAVSPAASSPTATSPTATSREVVSHG